MVEVFKTDVSNDEVAKQLVNQIHFNFNRYHANFDLDDCDRILRIKCDDDLVDAASIISILQKSGCNAEVLMDDFDPIISAIA